MNITDVSVKRIKTSSRMRGVASVVFDDCFVVHSIKIIESDNGLFIAMPSIRNANGEFMDIAHPINSDMRAAIQNAVLAEYNKAEEE